VRRDFFDFLALTCESAVTTPIYLLLPIFFDEVEIVNNCPMNIWLYAKCRKYVDPDNPGEDLDDVEVEVKGDYR
jgi:hypothetical protein